MNKFLKSTSVVSNALLELSSIIQKADLVRRSLLCRQKWPWRLSEVISVLSEVISVTCRHSGRLSATAEDCCALQVTSIILVCVLGTRSLLKGC